MRKRCLNKNLLSPYWFLFTCGNFTLIPSGFFIFLGAEFFLNGFPFPSIVHPRPNLMFDPNFYFSLVVFCSHAAF